MQTQSRCVSNTGLHTEAEGTLPETEYRELATLVENKQALFSGAGVRPRKAQRRQCLNMVFDRRFVRKNGLF